MYEYFVFTSNPHGRGLSMNYFAWAHSGFHHIVAFGSFCDFTRNYFTHLKLLLAQPLVANFEQRSGVTDLEKMCPITSICMRTHIDTIQQWCLLWTKHVVLGYLLLVCSALFRRVILLTTNQIYSCFWWHGFLFLDCSVNAEIHCLNSNVPNIKHAHIITTIYVSRVFVIKITLWRRHFNRSNCWIDADTRLLAEKQLNWFWFECAPMKFPNKTWRKVIIDEQNWEHRRSNKRGH